MSTAMDIREILRYLPHRYPFLLVDQVICFKTHESLVAIKNVTFNEPFFSGHFPMKPIMPGVLILEALAQACCILANKTTETKEENHNDYLYVLAGVDNVRFKRLVRPGDQLRLEVHIQKAKQDIWKFKCIASVKEELACSADIISAKKAIES